ncbi:HEAT repeat-containing protein 5A [Frankliniella fusca]|uniref:HEAT repeat-containing protein 5A n=1 Tax=Frankliniella fusca TaxID=407009 RepID=A0AAE1GVS6_9NEOP|nr:HEAT repeat-containing protein 5A [Frankliniella fusca]
MVFPHQDLLECRDVGDSYNDLVRNSIADPKSKMLKGVCGPTDKMPQAQFQNLELLVKGISLLNQESISIDNINEADEIFKQFCCGFQNIYGLRHMSSNIHLLRHLAQSVRETGPLFVTSAYKFEDLNGKMASLVHGTTQAPKQIFKNIALA